VRPCLLPSPHLRDFDELVLGGGPVVRADVVDRAVARRDDLLLAGPSQGCQLEQDLGIRQS